MIIIIITIVIFIFFIVTFMSTINIIYIKGIIFKYYHSYYKDIWNGGQMMLHSCQRIFFPTTKKSGRMNAIFCSISCALCLLLIKKRSQPPGYLFSPPSPVKMKEYNTDLDETSGTHKKHLRSQAGKMWAERFSWLLATPNVIFLCLIKQTRENLIQIKKQRKRR